MMTMPRKCTQCKIEQQIDQFSFRNKASNIRHRTCKNCMKLKTQAHYSKNKKIYKERAQSWANGNRKKRRAISASSQAYSRGAKRCHCCTSIELREFYENAPKDMTVDHIVEVHEGGSHCLSNLQYLTQSDNTRKTLRKRWDTAC